jgi:hypothetical protein
MTTTPYSRSNAEQQKWDDGFKAGLKEFISELEELKEETTDASIVEKLEALIIKITKRSE